MCVSSRFRGSAALLLLLLLLLLPVMYAIARSIGSASLSTMGVSSAVPLRPPSSSSASVMM